MTASRFRHDMPRDRGPRLVACTLPSACANGDGEPWFRGSGTRSNRVVATDQIRLVRAIRAFRTLVERTTPRTISLSLRTRSGRWWPLRILNVSIPESSQDAGRIESGPRLVLASGVASVTPSRPRGLDRGGRAWRRPRRRRRSSRGPGPRGSAGRVERRCCPGGRQSPSGGRFRHRRSADCGP